MTPSAVASRPPALPELDPAWSRLVTAPDADGVARGWHVLDSRAAAPDGNTVATLLCVHGNPTWSYLWRDLLARPPTGHRVVAVDQLDMGFSERTGTARNLRQRIADLGGLTDALELTGPVVTVAHDWGGPISLGWALAHRDQLAGIVLTNTAVHQPAGSPGPAVIRLARTPGVLDASCVTTSAFLRSALATARPGLSDAVRHAYLEPYRDAARRRGIGGFVRDIPLDATHGSAAVLDRVARGVATLGDVPALLLWGARDPVFSDRYLHDLEARLPQAAVHRFGDAGHLVPEDVDVAGALGTWLATLGSGSGLDAVAPSRDRPHGDERAPIWQRLDDPALRDRAAIVEMPSTDRRDHGESGVPCRRTFGELAEAVRHLAAGLTGHGVRAGDRVALLVPPGAELATVIYACWRIGAVAVVADAGLGARGITRALRSAAPDHLVGIPRALVAAGALGWPGRRIAAGGASERLRRLTRTSVSLDGLRAAGRRLPLPAPPGRDAEAAIVFTSGATGPAKGVVYRHRHLQAQRDTLVATYGISDDDRLVAAFAPFALYGPAMGITSVVPDMEVTSPRTLSATALGDAAEAVGATLVFASPAALVNIVATADDLPRPQRDALTGVRLLMSAGAPVPPDLLRAVGRVMPNADPHTPYGMTEALPVTDISLRDIESAGTGEGVCVGLPVAGVEVGISRADALGTADDPPADLREVTGEIVVRAEHTKDRYDRLWVTQQASARDPGWHRTGDVGHLDARGRLWVEGRMAHVITTAEGLVTPIGIERRVEGIAHVRAAAAVGVGPDGAQQLVVVVATDPTAPRAGLAPQSLTAAVRRAVEQPVAAVLVAPELPVDIRHNSKVDRSRLSGWATTLLAGRRAGRP